MRKVKEVKMGEKGMVQISTYNKDGEYQVLTVSFSSCTNCFLITANPNRAISVCEGTDIVNFNDKCETELVYTQKKE